MIVVHWSPWGGGASKARTRLWACRALRGLRVATHRLYTIDDNGRKYYTASSAVVEESQRRRIDHLSQFSFATSYTPCVSMYEVQPQNHSLDIYSYIPHTKVQISDPDTGATYSVVDSCNTLEAEIGRMS